MQFLDTARNNFVLKLLKPKFHYNYLARDLCATRSLTSLEQKS